MELEDIKKRTLVLTQTDPVNDMMFNAWRRTGLNADIIFKPKPKFIRMIRRLWADYFLPGYSLWYGKWKNELLKYDTVIVHADRRTRTVPRYIHSKKPSMRIIYWYWNPVNEETLPQLTKDDHIECWSFDENDCQKYHMNKNVQYYYDQSENTENSTVGCDVYFVGHDKGRKNKIQEMKESCIAKGLSVSLNIVEENQKQIPYCDVQKHIKKSKAILEVTQDGQVGCTLRAMEALFFRKKLITNNFNIINEDFYNKNNVFIYGKDNKEKLCEFVNKPYDIKSDKYRNKHTIEAWLENFFSRG